MGAKKNAKLVARYERIRKVIDLKMAGATFQQISDALKLGGQGNAFRFFREGMKLGATMSATEYIALWNERYERLVMAHWAKAKGGSCPSTDRVLAIARQQAELNGLNAPKRQELSGPNGAPLSVEASPAEAARLVREVFGSHAAMRLVPEGMTVDAASAGTTGAAPEPPAESGPLPSDPSRE